MLDIVFSYSREPVPIHRIQMNTRKTVNRRWLQNRLISSVLEPVFRHTEKSCTNVLHLCRKIILFLVFIRIRWIGTGSHPYEKTMSSIVLYPAFYEYKNLQSLIVHSISAESCL